MPDGQVLEFDRVTKRFGEATAVSDFSGSVRPGVVTGFLGPNGAGKTTTLRMLLGQIRPTSGAATIGGAQYSELKHPARVIGAMHEDPGFRPRRTVERHLIAAAKANGIALSRVSEVIGFVGLGGEADSRIGNLSLGMRQRLSAATALLGDPGALVLDEPANGLDPEGIRWMRMLIRGLADEGRTVLVSSHVLSEVEQVADDILIIARGQRKFAGSLAGLANPSAGPVVVDAVDRHGLTTALKEAGFEFEVLRSGLTVRGSNAAAIGAVAARAGVALTTLQQRGPTLEDVFLDLVNDRPVQLRKPEPADATTALPAVAEPAASTLTEVDVSPGSTDVVSAAVETAALTVSDADAGPVPSSGAPADEDSAEGLHTADASAADSFAPRPAAEDRPLPGLAGLAAMAGSVTVPAPADQGDQAADPWAPVEGEPSPVTEEDGAEQATEPSGQDAGFSDPSDREPEYTEYAHEAHAAEQSPPEQTSDENTPAEHPGTPSDGAAEASGIISEVPGNDEGDADAAEQFFSAFEDGTTPDEAGASPDERDAAGEEGHDSAGEDEHDAAGDAGWNEGSDDGQR